MKKKSALLVLKMTYIFQLSEHIISIMNASRHYSIEYSQNEDFSVTKAYKGGVVVHLPLKD